MPDARSLEKLNHAVQDCLQHCRQSESPLTGLAEFCQRLRDDLQWTELEIRKVRIAVHSMLKQIMREQR